MRRLPRPLAIAAGVAAVVLVAIGIVVALRRTTTADSVSTRVSDATITARDGVRLAARVTEPRSAGPFPLVVMPASWSQPAAEYDAVAQRLAARGFAVVAYTQRGFRGSGGTIDFAAAKTRRDVSTVVSWGIAHAAGDRKRVGVMGASYGGGIGLLAAEHDPRIKAVVALSTWTDWGYSFLPNHTVATALSALLATGAKTGRLDRRLTTLARRLKSNLPAAAGQIRAMSAQRSPITAVKALNDHGTAVMIANGFEDSLLPPGPLIGFIRALTGPKRLELAPGDHLGPEATGLQGYDNQPVDDGIDWLDRYLDGARNGIGRQRPVHLEDVTTQREYSYRHWPRPNRTLRIGRPYRRADLVPSAQRRWSATITTGTDSTADSAPRAAPAPQYSPPTLSVSEVSGARSFAWDTAPYRKATTVAGAPSLTVQVSAAARTASLYAYLYDVDPFGKAQLMSATPYTATHLSAARPTTVSFRLEPVAWTLPAKHRVALLIDTVDPRFTSTAPRGKPLTLRSTPAHPATLRLPVRP